VDQVGTAKPPEINYYAMLMLMGKAVTVTARVSYRPAAFSWVAVQNGKSAVLPGRSGSAIILIPKPSASFNSFSTWSGVGSAFAR
jgi:hypothetical protein